MSGADSLVGQIYRRCCPLIRVVRTIVTCAYASFPQTGAVTFKPAVIRKCLAIVWPDPPANKRQAISIYFDNTTSITRTLQKQDLSIATNGARETMKGLVSDLATFKDRNQSSSKNKKISFLFKKTEGGWIIEDVQ